MYEYTKDDYWKSKAQEFTANIEDQKTNGGTHDMALKCIAVLEMGIG